MNMQNLEFCQETLIGQPVTEIPANPPLEKGGQGGFLAGPLCWGKYYLLGAALPIYG
jgi:hypothetical protein